MSVFKDLLIKTRSMNIDSLRVLDSIDQYVFCKDTSSTYIFVNEPFARISGCGSKDEVIGKTDRDLVWRRQADFYELSDREVLSGKSLVRDDQVQIRMHGSSRIVLTKKPLLSENGDIIGIVGNFFDSDNSLILETSGDFDEEKGRLYLGFNAEWLSFSEVRICFYLIHGFSAPKIAEKSGISISGVRYHIENIKNKMQCSTKGEIPSVAMKTGIAWKILSLQHVGELENER